MKKLMRRIDRFCITHPRFGIKNLMLYIVIGNAVVWLFSLMDQSDTLEGILCFSAAAVFERGQVWRLFSFVLVPDIAGILALLGLYFEYFIGSSLENQWGKGKFTIYFLFGVALNILYGTLMWFIGGMDVPLSMWYLNLSMFFAFATMYPDMQVLIMFIIPVKMKWLAIIDALYFVVCIVILPFPVNLLPLVAIANYLIFCGGWLFDFLRPARVKQKKNTIDFKRAAKKYNTQQAKLPYTRKCEVCGRTDASDPELEFRFCSKCEGYHCFCIDHIGSHVHYRQ